ncbi:MAG: GMC family oxidoreductase [Myxococcales bacterium]|nr:GMC family oxidoreductase [Myxococcales bacterium]
MSGYVARGATKPETGARLGKQRKERFEFDLRLSIPRLSDFIRAGTHVAKVTGGTVYWKGVAKRTKVGRGGTVVMYTNRQPDGRRKSFDFTFSFRDNRGRTITCHGEKRLFDDRGFDAAADLSSLFVTLHRDGQQVAAGVTTVHIDELLDQVFSMKATGASGAEARAATQAFFTFMNRQLGRVYKSLPPLFSRHDDMYLRRTEWRALSLVTRALLPKDLPADGPKIKQVVANLENFIRYADTEQLEEIRDQLRILGTFSFLLKGFIPALRRWVQKTLASTSPSSLRSIFEQMHQIAVLPYFSHPKADALVGYQRPSFEPKYHTKLPIRRTPSKRTFDVCIVGAGVAGSLLAERLTAKGQSVLILEAGPYVAEKDISTDELRWTAQLYKGSGLQIANQSGVQARRSGPLTVLQGACVGGGATINNAVCFQLPNLQLKKWLGLGFPVDPADLGDAYRETARELDIGAVSNAAKHLNPAGRFLTNAFGLPRISSVHQPPTQGFYECLVNLDRTHGCEGLGLCNSGCGSERKRNALQVHLPAALARDCELVPNAKVMQVKLSRRQPGKSQRVESLIVDVEGTSHRVEAKEFIISAGAISSSALLLGSPDVDELRKRRRIPIGARLSANIGCPLFGFFDEVVHTRPSVQIAHYYMPPSGSGFIIESWFAPPGTLALTMPGFGDLHWRRMMSYQKTVTVAPLVGSQASGSVAVKSGRTKITLPITDFELRRIRQGIATLAGALLQGGASAAPYAVIAGTRLGYRIKAPEDIKRFERFVREPTQLRMGTGHPQGGNAMSRDPSISVVDENFRLRGVSNLRICDSSVFPMVAGVNPQWTVMALAQHCAKQMEG